MRLMESQHMILYIKIPWGLGWLGPGALTWCSILFGKAIGIMISGMLNTISDGIFIILILNQYGMES